MAGESGNDRIKMMKVIGICGSPREKSNSTRMVEEVLRGAKENGVEVGIIKGKN